MTPDVGVFLPYLGKAVRERPGINAAARHAEDVGLDSLWVGDNLAIPGTPILESTLSLATAAAVTERINLGFAVFLPALRPYAWAAKQIATLQHLSGGDRIHLGIGVGGGDEWEAAGVPSSERGRRTDEFLSVLPSLLAGTPTSIPNLPGEPVVTLAPSAPMPPVWIGGGSPAALRRTARFGDGWLADLVAPDQLRATGDRLRELAGELGRPAPRLGTAILGALEERPKPGLRDEHVERLAATYSLDIEDARRVVVAGGPEEVAERLAEYVSAGAEKFAFASSGDWHRTCDLLARVRELLAKA
jgi:alkanesulfonate monooxygenase SsuD/methylene tetrahydromethanopterin reductase-like flavin-dependent oxidoreductase (luciferase family)